MAQALGGRYDLSHGAMNAICLAPALRFNEPVVPDAIFGLARALGTDDAPATVEELAQLGGFDGCATSAYRTTSCGIRGGDRRSTGRAGKPAPASVDDIEALLLGLVSR
jgi:hypothetical protein